MEDICLGKGSVHTSQKGSLLDTSEAHSLYICHAGWDLRTIREVEGGEVGSRGESTETSEFILSTVWLAAPSEGCPPGSRQSSSIFNVSKRS